MPPTVDDNQTKRVCACTSERAQIAPRCARRSRAEREAQSTKVLCTERSICRFVETDDIPLRWSGWYPTTMLLMIYTAKPWWYTTFGGWYTTLRVDFGCIPLAVFCVIRRVRPTNSKYARLRAWWYARQSLDDIPPSVDDIQRQVVVFLFSLRENKKTAPTYGNGNNYTIHSHIHQYAPKITVGHRRSLLVCIDWQSCLWYTRFHKRDSEVIFGQRQNWSSACHGTCRLAHTPYRDRTVPDSLCHFCAATVFVTVFRFFTHRFYYKYFKKSILF